MIHRPFILHSFRSDADSFRYAQTRRTVVAAAKTILSHHERHAHADLVSMWTHSAFAVTAANVLGLELYHTNTNAASAAEIRDILTKAQERLLRRRGDKLADRSAELIGSILRFDKERAWMKTVEDTVAMEDIFKDDYMSRFFGLDDGLIEDEESESDPQNGKMVLLEEFEPWFTQAFFTANR